MTQSEFSESLISILHAEARSSGEEMALTLFTNSRKYKGRGIVFFINGIIFLFIHGRYFYLLNFILSSNSLVFQDLQVMEQL